MSKTSKKTKQDLYREIGSLPLPNGKIQTPCFVILEKAMLHNLRKTILAAGSADRLMPHIKTHRAEWVVKWMLHHGIRHFKTATPAEVEICLKAGADHVLWAYPTASSHNIARIAATARSHPNTHVQVLYDSEQGLKAWLKELDSNAADNIKLVLDLDPGMGRTGAEIGPHAAQLARVAHKQGLFDGWHIYDGHIQDIDRQVRIDKNAKIVKQVKELISPLVEEGLTSELTASGSWSFDIWPETVAKYVSPGSFIYSSAQHTCELPHLDWKIAAYVLTSVVSTRPGMATLDAGSKAISPDIPMKMRFAGAGEICGMKEEHSIIKNDNLEVGEYIPIVPYHTCTTAYLYNKALVLTREGQWEYREQLGCQR